MKNKSIFSLIFILLTGCAATGAYFSGYEPLNSMTGEIIVYRPSSLVMSGAYPYIYVNGERISKLKNAGYVQFQQPPGKHTLEIKGNSFLGWSIRDIKTEIQVEAGKRYIFRLEPLLDGIPTIIGNAGYVAIGSNFGAVLEDAAKQELIQLKNSFEQ